MSTASDDNVIPMPHLQAQPPGAGYMTGFGNEFASEAIAGTQQLQHADLLATRLDVQPHGIADHQQCAYSQ